MAEITNIACAAKKRKAPKKTAPAKKPEMGLTEASGYLKSGGDHILAQVREKDAENAWQLALAPWLNADLRAIGVVISETKRTYHVEIRDGNIRQAAITSNTIGSRQALSQWFAGHGLSLAGPDGIYPRGMRTNDRLSAYLESQHPPEFAEVDALGWHKESKAFITHEGIIRADGPHPFETVRPKEGLLADANFHYGFEGADGEAAAVLREILTFHDETVTAVFGAWWAACLLKPQIAAKLSQFPFMALEAPSGSAKTTGFTPCMYELGGAHVAQSVATKAVFRNAMAAHHNGIVWIDDFDDLAPYAEALRAATVGGVLKKMKIDNSTADAYPMRAAALISGESLGLHGQKALLDRCIRPEWAGIDIAARRSLHGDYSQLADIVKLKEAHPDLTVFAGTFVVKALGLLGGVEATVAAARQKTVSGRHSDSMTVLRAGAWLLEQLAELEPGTISNRVDLWTQQQLFDYDQSANTLTTKLLPEALTRLGKPERPMGPESARSKPASPVFVTAEGEESEMWFSPKLLAAWWDDLKHGRIVERTESAEAIEQQARDLGLGGKKGGMGDPDSMRALVRFTTGSGSAIYWRVPRGLAETITARAEGSQKGP